MKKKFRKSKKRVGRKQGFFQSPLYFGLLNLLPIILVFVSLFYLVSNIMLVIKNDNQVLGIESEREAGERIRIIDRIDELTKVLNVVESEVVFEEINQLKSL